jgi:large subunit ribosomal protein L2
MGKTIIAQARGHGSLTYRVRKKAFKHKIAYAPQIEGEAKVIKLIHSLAHSAPVAKLLSKDKVFYNLSTNGMYEGQIIKLGNEIDNGNIVKLKDIPTKTQIYNIESRPNDGGKFIRSAGGYATVIKKEKGFVYILMPSKKEKMFKEDCRATIGVIAGSGKKDKPIIKAGRMHFIRKSRNKFWPRTSAVKVNAIDHPFGSGRGKNLTHGGLGKIPKRNAPPGALVGSIRASRTGRKKGGK